MLVERVPTLGHEVVVFDIRSGGSSTAQVGGVTILPAVHDPIGNDVIPAHYQRSKSDVCITLCDAWGFNPSVMGELNWWPIAPVDHAPVPPAVVNSLRAAKGVIALSRFGQSELRKIGIDALYMPHGLEPAIWQPALTRSDMDAARQRIGLPRDTFIVSFCGVNDSNPSRKGISELLAAWSLFHRDHPDSLLYLHTTNQGNIPVAGPKNGVDIDMLVSTFGIDPRSVILPDQYRLRTGIPANELADIARGSDAFILPTRGEGFGVPLIEFQHAGCPVITTDFAAGAELCASGWLIEYEIGWSWQNATYANPGIASIREKLEQAYGERGNMARRQQAAEFGRDYEIDYVVQKFLAPCLAHIAETVVLGQRVTV
jgi:glycosyltransferase involved in cell wall biosynthesis